MNISASSIKIDLDDLRNQRRKLNKELEELDTKIIGMKLFLEAAIEKERYLSDQEKSMERFVSYNEK